MPISGFTPQQTNDPLIQRIQADLQKTISDIVRVLNALNPTITPGTPTVPSGTVNLLGLPQPGANGGIATLDGSGKLTAGQIPTGVELQVNKDAANGYAGLTAGSLIKVAELLGLAPSFTTLDITGAAPGTPVLQRIYQQSVVKAWVCFSISGGATTILAAFNVSSVTYVAAGRYTPNFATALTDANYAGVFTAGFNAAAGVLADYDSSATKLAGSCQFRTLNPTTGGTSEASIATAVFFGN